MDTSSISRDKCVAEVVELLVQGHYDDLERLSGGVRLSAQELASAVAHYGRTLALPPDAGPKPDFMAVLGTSPPAWSVWVPLFTREEGRSDLTLQLTLAARATGGFKVEIDDLGVL